MIKDKSKMYTYFSFRINIFKDFFMGTIFKVFNEFVTLLFLFSVLIFFLSRRCLDLSCLARNRTCIPSTVPRGKSSLLELNREKYEQNMQAN